MKKNIALRVSFLIMTVLVSTTCTKTYIEKSQDGYSAANVVPVILGTSGPTTVLRSFSFNYGVTYDRAGSTWAWSATDATVQSVSSDTKTATILFSTLPASGKAYIKVTETSAGGVVSEQKSIEVTVNQFCPLAVSAFAGSWPGTDGFGTGPHLRASQVVITNPTASAVKVTGLNFGWITDKWGETITAGGTINMTVNPNGTTVIPDQYCFTTDYDGAPYEYWINGTGSWGNCGASPNLTINYVVYYKSDGSKLPADYYAGYTTFVATLTKAP
jgi:hypothetical protein